MSTTRQTDERDLLILSRAYAGETLAAIADSLGITKEYVRTIARRVLVADLTESGEPESVVRPAYPWARV